jgi:hypothetical protein
MNLQKEIADRMAHAHAAFDAKYRPMVEKETRAQYDEWKRNNPRSRVCYFCKRVHRRPHLLFVVDRQGEHRRWTSRACFEKRTGIGVAYGLVGDVWKIYI